MRLSEVLIPWRRMFQTKKKASKITLGMECARHAENYQEDKSGVGIYCEWIKVVSFRSVN